MDYIFFPCNCTTVDAYCSVFHTRRIVAATTSSYGDTQTDQWLPSQSCHCSGQSKHAVEASSQESYTFRILAYINEVNTYSALNCHVPHVAEAPCHWEHSGRTQRMAFQWLQPSDHRHTGTNNIVSNCSHEWKCCYQLWMNISVQMMQSLYLKSLHINPDI